MRRRKGEEPQAKRKCHVLLTALMALVPVPQEGGEEGQPFGPHKPLQEGV